MIVLGPPITDTEKETEGQLTLWTAHEMTRKKWCIFCSTWVDKRTNAGHFAACLTLNPNDPS